MEEAKAELKFKEALLKEYKSRNVATFPGSLTLRIKKDGKEEIYWETRKRVNGKTVAKRVIISKEMTELANSIYLKQFYTKSIRFLEADISGLKALIGKYMGFTPARVVGSLGSAYAGRTLDMNITGNTKNPEWNDMLERQNLAFPENLKHSGPGGNYRSKSEVMISLQLYAHGIAFKYEPAIKLEKRTVYPDFAIFDAKSSKIIYWEHAGMLDNADYAENLGLKLREYSAHNINVGENLIFTTESLEKPLSTICISNIIRNHFINIQESAIL